VKNKRTKKAPRKSSSSKYKKRHRRELENRAIKDQERMMAEVEFAQRIQKEPSLKEVIERGREIAL